MVALQSTVDPTFPGQEDILPPETAKSTKAVEAVEGSNVKTSKTGDRPRAQALAQAVEQSEKALGVHRSNRRLFIRQYAGSNYGDINAAFRDPMNLLYSLVSTLVPALAVDPKATVSTVAGNRAFAETLRLAIDDEAERITLAKTLKAVVIDSLFGLGVIKTGLKASPGFQDEGNLETDAGTLFSERVSFANYVIDMASTTRAQAQFEGDRYSITEDAARKSGMFDEMVLQQLIAASGEQRRRADGGYANGPDWSNGLAGDDEFIRRLFLVDLYLPTEGKVVTIPGDVAYANLGFLNEVDWDGDPSGPYDTIGFSPVPDKILPTPVVGVIYDLYTLLNKIAGKVGRQSDRQKDIVLFQKGLEDDGDAVRDSNDGEIIGVTDTDHIKEVSFGGASEDSYKAIAWYQDYLNKIAGNPDLIGGLAANAKTLGQDQLSLHNANGRIDDWRQTVMEASSSVLRKIAGYIWTDTETVRKLELKAGGLVFPREFGKTREGVFEDYRIAINATHRPPMSPDQRYLRTQRWITEVLIPLKEAAAAQGMALDVEKVANITAEQLGIEDAESMFVPVEDIPRMQQPAAPAGPQNPEQGPRLSQPKPSLEGV